MVDPIAKHSQEEAAYLSIYKSFARIWNGRFAKSVLTFVLANPKIQILLEEQVFQ